MDEATTRVPLNVCWHCDRLSDALSAMDDDAKKPEPGAITFCFYCGVVAVLDEELRSVAPSEDLLAELGDNREFRNEYARWMWARQRFLRDTKLMGSEAERRAPKFVRWHVPDELYNELSTDEQGQITEWPDLYVRDPQ